ncbi:MAG: hypothetical protein QM503_03010 [Bacteroidota bacterium]
MKTKIKKYTLAFLAVIMVSTYVEASTNFGIAIEEYKDCSSVKTANYASLNYDKALAVNFNFDEENYVNDIPFSTNVISSEYNYLNAISEDFEMKEESYINDIPFNTKKMVREFNN